MRSVALFSGIAALWVFAACGSSTGGSSQAGGSTNAASSKGGGASSSSSASGGNAGGSESSSSGGKSAAGGTGGGATASGGTTSGGGTRATGGTPAGGSANTGGRGGTAGSSANGGTGGDATPSGGASTGGRATGGKTTAGGAGGNGGKTGSEGGAGGATAGDYQGPCDVLAKGCAEAFGMARAMTAKYTGPLFQIGVAKDKTKLLDIGQTTDRKADMTTWNSFCGGNQSNCVVSKIYAQINTGKNDLVPAVFNAPYGPNCSAGGYTCAAKFTIESATGLPILSTDSPQEYTIANDDYATGINGGSKAMGLMYNGKPVPKQVYCCGVFGLTHKWNQPDTHGTDFMVALAYGWRDGGGCCIAVNCGAENKYCVGAEEEENNDLYDYGTEPVENAMVVTQFDPGPNAVISFLNGTQVLSHSPPKAKLNAGTAIHLGGGGDLSQPDPVRMREALITNNVMSTSEVTAMKNNITAFFSTLKFQ